MEEPSITVGMNLNANQDDNNTETLIIATVSFGKLGISTSLSKKSDPRVGLGAPSAALLYPRNQVVVD
ncbi:hypothetical protein QJS10_CPA06g01059 [Acorus calamus]|uniref:Uncharacterized protein n=1 Tax=Acorus calamus TaxID=4465 RepID=A0AAV9ELB4_ACOCL|nr:hypothetical protein QJS10_CPA06g01059 [Acorus calamus]